MGIFKKIFKKNETYAEAIHKITLCQQRVSGIICGENNRYWDDFFLKKNEWCDLPESHSKGVSYLGLRLDEEFTSAIGYFSENSYINKHSHSKDWQYVRVLEGEIFINDIKIKTNQDIWLSPDDEHGLMSVKESYIYVAWSPSKIELDISFKELKKKFKK